MNDKLPVNKPISHPKLPKVYRITSIDYDDKGLFIEMTDVDDNQIILTSKREDTKNE